MIRFRYFYDDEINSTHVNMHDVSEKDLLEYFTNIPIWKDYRKDGSIEAIGKLSNGRYLRVIYKEITHNDLFIITAYDIAEGYIKDFIEKELKEL